MGGLANFKLKTWRGKKCKNTHRTRTEFDHCATIGTDIHVDWSDNDVEYFINKRQPLEY